MYLGIDWGEKNIGIAVADKEDKIATPLKTISNSKNLVSRIGKICRKHEVKKIIVGIPKSFDGENHETAQKVKSFAQKLESKLQPKVELENEIFTSKIASEYKTTNLDKRAATIILQSYLDKQKNTG